MTKVVRSQYALSLFLVLFLMGIGTSSHAGALINKHLPDPLKVDLEFRHRMEYRNNFDFRDSIDDKDTFHLGRTRLNLNFQPIKELGFFIQGQDSKIWESQVSNKAPFENYFDLRQLYIDYMDEIMIDALTLNKLSARVGRQEFSYGAQRLLGGFNWSNVAQTFDGGKIGAHFSTLHLQLDIFTGDKTSIKSPREMDDLFDGSSRERIYAYYATAKAFHESLIENYLIRRETWRNISFGPSGSGEVDNYTLGGRIKKAFSNGIDYEVETAGQWGDFKDQDVRAMMAVGILGYTLDHPWKPRVAFEFDYGSGDSDPSDGKLTTFDNLYPTNHLFYGYIDFISLQNLNDYRFQISAKPHKKWKLQADLHLIYLDTVKDSYYSVGRSVVRTASGPADDHLGDEIDVTADYKFNDYVNIGVGYSHFFAGDYLRDTGANDAADFFYLQTTILL